MVLLDLMMPGDGWVPGLRNSSGKLMGWTNCLFSCSLPEIRSRIWSRALPGGANDYVTKPFSKKELIARIETQLRLLAAKDRLVNLRKFMNRIESYVDTDQLFKEAFNAITREAPFQNGHTSVQ